MIPDDNLTVDISERRWHVSRDGGWIRLRRWSLGVTNDNADGTWYGYLYDNKREVDILQYNPPFRFVRADRQEAADITDIDWRCPSCAEPTGPDHECSVTEGSE